MSFLDISSSPKNYRANVLEKVHVCSLQPPQKNPKQYYHVSPVLLIDMGQIHANSKVLRTQFHVKHYDMNNLSSPNQYQEPQKLSNIDRNINNNIKYNIQKNIQHIQYFKYLHMVFIECVSCVQKSILIRSTYFAPIRFWDWFWAMATSAWPMCAPTATAKIHWRHWQSEQTFELQFSGGERTGVLTKSLFYSQYGCWV